MLIPRMLPSPRSLSLTIVMMFSLLKFFTCKKVPFGGESEYLDEISYNIIIGQLKQRILRGMNRSEPPQFQPIRTSKLAFQIQAPRSYLVTSQSPDFERPDVISFKLDSCIRSHVLDIEQVLLVFLLRFPQRHHQPAGSNGQSGSHRKQTRKCSPEETSQHRERPWRARIKRGHLDEDIDPTPATVTARSYTPDSLLRLGNTGSLYSLKAYRARNVPRIDRVPLVGPEVPRVKIVVRVVNTTTGRKRNVALEHMETKRTTAVLVSIPTKYVKRAVVAADRTLTVQIACRGCGQHAWVESVYKHSRRGGGKHGRSQDRSKILSPNRPLLYVDIKNSTCSGRPWNRPEHSQNSKIHDMTNSSGVEFWEQRHNTSRGHQEEAGG